MSEAEEELHWQLIALKIPHEREVLFAPPRKWRADFVITKPLSESFHDRFVEAPLLIEVDGGAFSGGRHTSGAGYRADLEKLNKATELGYRVLRYLPEQVESGEALAQIEKLLEVTK